MEQEDKLEHNSQEEMREEQEQKPTRREWVKPTFERLELKDAMTGIAGVYDGLLYYS